MTTQTNLAREHAVRSDRTIEDLMERLDKQELRHQQVVDTLQKQVAAAGATPLPGAAPSSSLPTSQPYGRLPSAVFFLPKVFCVSGRKFVDLDAS